MYFNFSSGNSGRIKDDIVILQDLWLVKKAASFAYGMYSTAENNCIAMQ